MIYFLLIVVALAAVLLLRSFDRIKALGQVPAQPPGEEELEATRRRLIRNKRLLNLAAVLLVVGAFLLGDRHVSLSQASPRGIAGLVFLAGGLLLAAF
jgi:hypothetical protein